MSTYDLEISSIQTDLTSERKPVADFLESQQLSYDLDVEHTIVARSNGIMVGTGSLAGGVLKCIAVDQSYQGEALTNKIVGELELEAYYKGIEHLFVFTKAKNRAVFQSLGFGVVAESSAGEQTDVVLLEKPDGQVESWLKTLEKYALPGGATALVMNCNPFTLGHRYLVEQASRRAAETGQRVHLFVVSAERSLFPEEVRFQLVREGTREFENVLVHHGGPYIISGATFPSYFLRDSEEVTAAHARLDLHIFGEKIAPALEIRRRMVGEEPYCPVTAAYNRQMQEILPHYGIEVKEIPRLSYAGEAVSASKVRQLIRENRWNEMKELLPAVTWRYLNSPEAGPVVDRIHRENRRH